MMPVVVFAGKSDSGKTTLIEKLIAEIKSRCYRVGVIKHTAHGFDMDQPGKDSWRHQKAGADTVLLAAPDSLAMIKKQASAPLDDLLTYFEGMDLVLVEGFKLAEKPKIEILRAASNAVPFCRGDRNLIALVTDTDTDLGVPRFDLNDISRIADFLEEKFLQK